MKKIKIVLYFLFSLTILLACSQTQESTNSGEDVYVFDQGPSDDKFEMQPTGEYPNLNEAYYVVQIGAFTTREKAEGFAEMSRNKLKSEISVSYSDDVRLYVVQLIPFYRSKADAEIVKENLRSITEFEDAWILTVNK